MTLFLISDFDRFSLVGYVRVCVATARKKR